MPGGLAGVAVGFAIAADDAGTIGSAERGFVLLGKYRIVTGGFLVARSAKGCYRNY